MTNPPPPEGQQPISVLTFPCPGADPNLSVAAPPTWNKDAYPAKDPWGTRALFLCNFSWRDAWLEPGQQVEGLEIHSSWLPAVEDSAKAWGVAEIAVLPGDAGDAPDTVYRLVDQVQGYGYFDGSGLSFAAVVPARSPAEFSHPSRAVGWIATDLERVCALRRIPQPGVCQSLAAKLQQASRSLAQGRVQAARGQLQSFLQELEAQHGPEPGKHVSDNAYWLLKINVQYVLSRL